MGSTRRFFVKKAEWPTLVESYDGQGSPGPYYLEPIRSIQPNTFSPLPSKIDRGVKEYLCSFPLLGKDSKNQIYINLKAEGVDNYRIIISSSKNEIDLGLCSHLTKHDSKEIKQHFIAYARSISSTFRNLQDFSGID